jgi:hypothetical protein
MFADHRDSVAVPCLILAAINAKLRWDAHWEHQAHEEHVNPRSERPEYPYQNIRTKNFWWGDGDKVCNIASFLHVQFVGRFGSGVGVKECR